MTTTDKTLNEYHVFDGDPAHGGEPWRDGPFFFPSIYEAKEYVLGVLDRATVLKGYGGWAVVTIRGKKDGVWTGESVEVEVVAHDLSEYVLVETIPTSDRSSHGTAGNAGVYPLNGAVRVLMHRADAEEFVEADGGWSHIVRRARPEDNREYDVILDAASFTP